MAVEQFRRECLYKVFVRTGLWAFRIYRVLYVDRSSYRYCGYVSIE